MEQLKNYINGKWEESKSTRVLEDENPGTGDIIAKVPMSTRHEVDEGVGAAREAFGGWRRTPITERVEYLFRLRELMAKHSEELARVITIENGKVLEEARGDIRRTIENIDAAIGMPSLMQGKILEDVARGIDECFVRTPIGAFCIISPFNFPTMVPFWFIPYALACGDTLVVKPSEQTPMCMNRIFELMHEAGIPRGVINLVHGDKEVVDALLEHPDVVGVSSVTSTPVARYIYAKAAAHGKRTQCQAGAKNFLLVMPDADMEKAVPNIISAVFGNAGQRCLAGANVVAVGGIHDALVDALLREASKIKVGYGLDEGVSMGPVISGKAKERIIGYVEKGIQEGAKPLEDGRDMRPEKYPNGHYVGPTVLDDVRPEMRMAREEIFGPVMGILRARDLREAMQMISSNPYGNAATIYTSRGEWAREFEYNANCGNIGINVGIAAPIAFFPFTGMKESFFGDLHGQSPDAIDFFTHKKVIIGRWW